MTAESPPSTRDAILAAALRILREEGAARLNVRRVADLAGCSTTGIYTYFGGKQGLVAAIFIEGFESFDAALAVHHRRGDILAGAQVYRSWALSNPMHYLVMFGRAVADFTPDAHAVDRAGESFRALTSAMEIAGSPEPQRAALHLYATMHGYVMLEIAGLAPPGFDGAAAYDRGVGAAIEQILSASDA